MKLRVYLLPNADGVHSELVAAPNQKEAARLMNSSLRHFKAYAGQVTTDPVLVEVAMREPGRVWKQKIPTGSRYDPLPEWIPVAKYG